MRATGGSAAGANTDMPLDGWEWRKYGQKTTLGQKYPRYGSKCVSVSFVALSGPESGLQIVYLPAMYRVFFSANPIFPPPVCAGSPLGARKQLGELNWLLCLSCIPVLAVPSLSLSSRCDFLWCLPFSLTPPGPVTVPLVRSTRFFSACIEMDPASTLLFSMRSFAPPRNYYRCSHYYHKTAGPRCPAKKWAERCNENPSNWRVKYVSEHNHPKPPPRPVTITIISDAPSTPQAEVAAGGGGGTAGGGGGGVTGGSGPVSHPSSPLRLGEGSRPIHHLPPIPAVPAPAGKTVDLTQILPQLIAGGGRARSPSPFREMGEGEEEGGRGGGEGGGGGVGAGRGDGGMPKLGGGGVGEYLQQRQSHNEQLENAPPLHGAREGTVASTGVNTAFSGATETVTAAGTAGAQAMAEAAALAASGYTAAAAGTATGADATATSAAGGADAGNGTGAAGMGLAEEPYTVLRVEWDEEVEEGGAGGGGEGEAGEEGEEVSSMPSSPGDGAEGGGNAGAAGKGGGFVQGVDEGGMGGAKNAADVTVSTGSVGPSKSEGEGGKADSRPQLSSPSLSLSMKIPSGLHPSTADVALPAESQEGPLTISLPPRKLATVMKAASFKGSAASTAASNAVNITGLSTTAERQGGYGKAEDEEGGMGGVPRPEASTTGSAAAGNGANLNTAGAVGAASSSGAGINTGVMGSSSGMVSMPWGPGVMTRGSPRIVIGRRSSAARWPPLPEDTLSPLGGLALSPLNTARFVLEVAQAPLPSPMNLPDLQ